MSKKLQKINNLKKVEGFIQLNFIKGFKYVDKAGEFFNSFYIGDDVPTQKMDPTGMTVIIDNNTELKVSPHHLWMHFAEPATFNGQSDEFIKKTNLVNSVFEPGKYTRIGWRNHLVYECGENYPSIIPVDYLTGADFNEIVFTKVIKKFNVRVGVSKVVNQKLKTKAVLFDIDVFKDITVTRDNYTEIGSYLKSMEDEVYKSDELLETINNLLK